MMSWIMGGLKGVRLIAASIGGTLWFTRNSSESDDRKSTSMKAWREDLAKTGMSSPKDGWHFIKSTTCTSDGYDYYLTFARGEDAMSLSRGRIVLRRGFECWRHRLQGRSGRGIDWTVSAEDSTG